MTNLNQLLFNFNYKQNFNYDDFYVSKSNFFAFELIENWPHWEKNILNIYGEKYSGKSHLAKIFCNKNKGKKIISLDLVSNFYIENFSNKETIFKIIYNGTPDKFIEEFNLEKIKIDLSNNVWKIND